ncbi:molecular chaperone, partial [[Clostridium] clostridioforme]|nr:molecular chaperone [Enterocloster clostridioformis]
MLIYQYGDLALKGARLQERQDIRLQCSSKIIAYDGLAIGFYDGLTLPYEKSLAGTNALVVGGDMAVCAVLNVVPIGNRTDCLYLTKAAGLACRESDVKNYSLYCMGRR